jgi:hypothetical protein
MAEVNSANSPDRKLAEVIELLRRIEATLLEIQRNLEELNLE